MFKNKKSKPTGLKLKEGKEVIKGYKVGYHLTFEEWIKKDFEIQFYDRENDFHYTTNFNWSKPFNYITDGIRDKFIYQKIGIITLYTCIKDNYIEYIKNGSVSKKNDDMTLVIFHIWLKTYGIELMRGLYDTLGSKPTKELYDEDIVDFRLEFKKLKNGQVTLGLPLMDKESSMVYSNTSLNKTDINDISEEIEFLKEIKKYSKKIGRNQDCPCESGLKYKNCCLN